MGNVAGKDDGGPAFPNDFGVPGEKTVGMSLRDYFAGQMLAGECFSSTAPAEVAEWAYRVADAMIAERTKTNGVR